LEGAELSTCILVREDDEDLADLVMKLLEGDGYAPVLVASIQELLVEAVRRTPCAALVDGSSPTSYDMWWVGEVLSRLDVQALAFTGHASAQKDFEEDSHGFVGVVLKPFDVEDLLNEVHALCGPTREAAAS